MRFRAIVAAFLIVAACVPAGERPRSPQKPRASATQPTPPLAEAAMRQCLADLGAMQVQYERLPDRWFGGGCSAASSVKLVAIGIPVTNLGAIRCPLARQFAQWSREAIQQAARAWLDTSVTKVESFGTYACRSVNGVASGRLSEHAFANAVDIAAFQLADGRRITVKEGWNSQDANVRSFLRAIHSSACRRFATVLGPDYNAAHHDHFHFDMGRGPFCR